MLFAPKPIPVQIVAWLLASLFHTMPPTPGPSFVFYRLRLREEWFEDRIDVTGDLGENICIQDIQEAIRVQNDCLQLEEREYDFDLLVYPSNNASMTEGEHSTEDSTEPLSDIAEWDALAMGGNRENPLVVKVNFIGQKAPTVGMGLSWRLCR
jgi:hypothetical protein